MSYKIPLFDLNFGVEEEEAVLQTLRSKWISTGPKCKELEELLCSTMQVSHAVTLSSCTAALHLAMMALDFGPGDEVIVPSLTFAATVNAVKYVGATPVFADVKSVDDLTIDPEDIKNKISNNTKGIIPMHFGGFAADMDKILNLAKEYNLKVIEDTSHAPLSEYKGVKLGTLGDIGTFSFFSNKNISTGEGGCLVTNNEEIAQKVRLLRSHGMTTMSYERAKGHATSYDIQNLGYNYRMDDIRASIGIVQFKKLEADLRKRIENRKLYIQQLGNNPKIVIPFKEVDDFVSNYIFPVVLLDSNAEYREKVRNKLHDKGIQTSVHYPAVHKFSIYYDETHDLPVTDYIADNEITLPMYSRLEKSDVDFICNTLENILQ